MTSTLRAETFAGRNFRVFLANFAKVSCAKNFKSKNHESVFPRNCAKFSYRESFLLPKKWNGNESRLGENR